jgi:hypothetical protein
MLSKGTIQPTRRLRLQPSFRSAKGRRVGSHALGPRFAAPRDNQRGDGNRRKRLWISPYVNGCDIRCRQGIEPSRFASRPSRENRSGGGTEGPVAASARPPPTEMEVTVGVGSGVTFFFPGVGGIGVASDFPESEFVLGEERDVLHELSPFPGVKLGDDDAGRTAMLAWDGFSAK